MKAGRELDDLMATEVMGWVRHDYTAPILGTDDVERWTEWTDKTSCFKGICGVWKPSEDIAAAWEVAERLCNWDVDDNMLVLKGQGPDLTEQEPYLDDNGKQWWTADIQGTEGHNVGKAETAPHAICLAALKVKGIGFDT